MESNTPRNKTRSNPDMLPTTRLACRFKKRSMTALLMTFVQKHHERNRHGASSVLVAAPPRCATHYFQTAVDLSFCVQRSNASAEDGFYLITIKASRQAGLTGVKGGLLRTIAVDKTRSSLEKALNSIRENLEHGTELPSEKSTR